MSGSQRYWNEDAQRWEDRGDHGSPPGAVAQPPASSAGPLDAAPVPPGAGRRVLWPVVAAIAAVGVVVGVVVVGPGGDDGTERAGSSASPAASHDDTPADGEPSAGPSTPADGEPSAAPSTPAVPALPDGYKPVHEEEGFSTAIPEGSTRFRSNGSDGTFRVRYRDSVGKRGNLTVFEVAEPTIEESFAMANQPEGFHRLTPLEPFEKGTVTGKLVNFLLDDGNKVWYGVEIRFRAADGNLYGVTAQHADNKDVTRQRWIAATAAKFFCPRGQGQSQGQGQGQDCRGAVTP